MKLHALIARPMTVLRRTVRDAGAVIVLAGLFCAVSAWAAYTVIYDGRLEQERVSVSLEARSLAGGLVAGQSASEVVARAGAVGYDMAFVTDGSQRVLAGWPSGGLNTPQVLALPPSAKAYVPLSGGPSYTVGSAATERGHRLILLRAVQPGISVTALVALAFAVWMVIALSAIVVARRGRREDPELRELARALAAGRVSVDDRRDLVARHGSSANVLFDLAEELEATRAELAHTRDIGRAAFQLGPHYMLLCDFEGKVLDANPAFLARAGVTVEELSERSADILEDLLPVDELLDYGWRSLQEQVTLTGIPCKAGFQGEIRKLEASLRAVSIGSGPAMVLVLADHQRRDELERQIDQFMDSVDLMVDQRVAKIAQHHATFETVLSDAGLAVYEFSLDGATRKMNAAAERLIGRTQFTLRTLDDVVRAIVAEAPRRAAFREWFDSGARSSFITIAATPGGDRRMVWLTATERREEIVHRRLLVGMALPDVAVVDDSNGADAAIRSLDALSAALDPTVFPEGARTYVDVIREAVRRLDSASAVSGDGAVIAPADHLS